MKATFCGVPCELDLEDNAVTVEGIPNRIVFGIFMLFSQVFAFFGGLLGIECSFEFKIKKSDYEEKYGRL